MSAAYAKQVEGLATETRRRLLAIWDSLAPWGDAELDQFHRIAKPLVEAAAHVGIDITAAYLEAAYPGEAGTPSKLIPADASARLFDPSDRIGRLMANGATFEEATAAARQVVDDLGHDTAFRSAREAMADAAPPGKTWQRRVTGSSCKWCLSLAGAKFYSAASATFGHSHCDCLPMQTEAVAASNQAFIDAAGGDLEVRKYKQAGRLRQSERTARRRSEQARLDQITEQDPARRERLSIREQEWETRAERAAERLQRLLTPAA